MNPTKIAILNSIIRLPNILLSIIAGLIFCVFYLNESIANLKFILSMLIVVFSIATGNMINDYFDYVADQEKKTFKAIASGAISRSFVLNLYIIINLGSIIISILLLPLYSSICLIINIFCLFLYSYKLKSTILLGNICVAYLSASIFIYFGIIYNKVEIAFFPTFFAFFMHLIREIIKDLEDEQSDKLNDVKTLAVLHGINFTKKIVQVLIFVAICFFSIIVFTIISQVYIQVIFIGLIIIPLILIIFWLNTHLIERDFNKISQFLKLLMLIGLILLILTVHDFTTFTLFK